MIESQAILLFAALAQETRLKIIRVLVQSGPTGLAAGQLAERVGVSPSNLSFHLKELAHAGLISQERSGRNLIYRAAFDRMNGLVAYLTENCCQGGACPSPVAQAECAC